jgi:hypothetical protein
MAVATSIYLSKDTVILFQAFIQVIQYQLEWHTIRAIPVAKTICSLPDLRLMVKS